eukprot:scaffold25924_cov66-Phaeocystis_antarctica.AAC.3
MSRPAARPRPAPPPAAARRRGMRLRFPGGSAPRALAAPIPACPATPETGDLLRLAQHLATPHAKWSLSCNAHLAAQCCGHLVISPQLLQQRLRRLPQLVANATQGHGDARVEHVAQLGEDDARLVTAELGECHRGAGAREKAWV